MAHRANHHINSHGGSLHDASGTLHDASRREVSGTVWANNQTDQQIRQLKIENVNLKAHIQFIENANMALKKELSSFQQESNCLKCNIDVRVVHSALREEIRLLNERVRSIDHENYLLNYKTNDYLKQIASLTTELNILRASMPAKEGSEEKGFVVMYTELSRKNEALVDENVSLKRANRMLVERVQKLIAEKNQMQAYYGDYM